MHASIKKIAIIYLQIIKKRNLVFASILFVSIAAYTSFLLLKQNPPTKNKIFFNWVKITDDYNIYFNNDADDNLAEDNDSSSAPDNELREERETRIIANNLSRMQKTTSFLRSEFRTATRKLIFLIYNKIQNERVDEFFNPANIKHYHPINDIKKLDRRQNHPFFWLIHPPARQVFFTQFDINHHPKQTPSAYISSGYKKAWGGGDFHKNGWRSLFIIGTKLYEYDEYYHVYRHRPESIRQLIGYEKKFQNIFYSIFVGAAFYGYPTKDIIKTFHIGRLGLTMQADVFAHWPQNHIPLPQFTHLSLQLDTSSQRYLALLRHNIYHKNTLIQTGPELSISWGDEIKDKQIIQQEKWQKTRIGWSISNIQLDKTRFDLSFGREIENNHKKGYYGQFTILVYKE